MESESSRRSVIGGCAALLALPCLGDACAQAQAIDDISARAGADRTERLVAEARQEGALTLYSSAPVDDAGALTAAFEKKYGIKVRLWRGGSEAILTRALAESRGGRAEVDVIETAGPEMEALTREGLLQRLSSPALADLVASAVRPDGAWVATRYSVFAAAYNTTSVAAADVPRRYEDLLDSKWKGRLGIEADDANWFSCVVGALGERKGIDLFRDIVARNGISIRKGHSLLANLVVSGEVPLALTAYGYRVDRLKKAGAPIDKVYLPPVIALPTGVAVLRKAPHPFAAALFAEFMLTDAQAIMAERGYVVTKRNTGAMPANLAFIDLPKFLDERDKWTRLYKEIFINQAR
jgi:ABC-type Fe3+ transport system substrate-binding protein